MTQLKREDQVLVYVNRCTQEPSGRMIANETGSSQSIYTLLGRMVERGLLFKRQGDPADYPGTPPTFYRTTERGRERVAEIEETLDQIAHRQAATTPLASR